MRGIVLKPFPWSADGIKVEHLSAKDERDFQSGVYIGLLRAGYISAPVDQAGYGAAEHQAQDGAPENGSAAGAPETKEGEGAVALPGSEQTGADGSTGQGDGDAGGSEGQTGSGAAETGDLGGEITIKHVGRGKYALFRGEERLTEEPLEKDEAETELAKLKA